MVIFKQNRDREFVGNVGESEITLFQHNGSWSARIHTGLSLSVLTGNDFKDVAAKAFAHVLKHDHKLTGEETQSLEMEVANATGAS